MPVPLHEFLLVCETREPGLHARDTCLSESKQKLVTRVFQNRTWVHMPSCTHSSSIACGGETEAIYSYTIPSLPVRALAQTVQPCAAWRPQTPCPSAIQNCARGSRSAQRGPAPPPKPSAGYARQETRLRFGCGELSGQNNAVGSIATGCVRLQGEQRR